MKFIFFFNKFQQGNFCLYFNNYQSSSRDNKVYVEKINHKEISNLQLQDYKNYRSGTINITGID